MSVLGAVDDLKAQLSEATTEKDAAQAELDTVLSEQKETQDQMASELAAAKITVAELSQERDKMHHSLVTLLRTSTIDN